jgi:hypothetical protein
LRRLNPVDDLARDTEGRAPHQGRRAPNEVACSCSAFMGCHAVFVVGRNQVTELGHVEGRTAVIDGDGVFS